MSSIKESAISLRGEAGTMEQSINYSAIITMQKTVLDKEPAGAYADPLRIWKNQPRLDLAKMILERGLNLSEDAVVKRGCLEAIDKKGTTVYIRRFVGKNDI